MRTVQSVSMSERSAQRTGKRKVNEQSELPRDPSGKWQREVTKLEERLGFPRKFLWHWFDQLALCVEFEQKLDRYLSEHAGFRLLRGMFDKVELGAEVN